MRTTDPETGYVGRETLGQDYGPEVRCTRCGGRGMWKSVGGEGKPGHDRVILCLRCADDEDGIFYALLQKHGYVWSHKKWMAAFDEFCSTQPRDINTDEHNRRIALDDKMMHSLYPELFSKAGEFSQK